MICKERLAAIAAVLAIAVVGAPAVAQQAAAPKPSKAAGKRPEVLEIRAQAPTPQVVTVRPRVIPAFRAEALDSTIVDRHFVAALRAPYLLIPLAENSLPAPSPAAPSPAVPSSPVHAPSQE
jgi:hypothetical protein